MHKGGQGENKGSDIAPGRGDPLLSDPAAITSINIGSLESKSISQARAETYFERHKKPIWFGFNVLCFTMMGLAAFSIIHEEEGEIDTVDRVDQYIYGLQGAVWFIVCCIGNFAFYVRNKNTDAKPSQLCCWNWFCPARFDQAADYTESAEEVSVVRIEYDPPTTPSNSNPRKT